MVGWLGVITLLAAASVVAGPLALHAPVVVPRAAGYFDYMTVDATRRRLIVSHTGSQAVAFLDVASGKLERQLYVGTAHGIAIDERDDRYFVGTSGATHVVTVIDRRTLKIVGSIPMPGPIDALAFDSRRDMLYADEDNGDRIWLVSIPGDAITATLHTPQDSDKIEYDRSTDRLYQNFTTINAMLVIDPASHATIARWSTLPARRPHGLAVDSAHGFVYAAGANGKLVELDLHSGALVSSVPIATNVDQMALDLRSRRVYCASGNGVVSVVDVREPTMRFIANVPVPQGAHTIAWDPQSGVLWISYGTVHDDYIMKLTPAP